MGSLLALALQLRERTAYYSLAGGLLAKEEVEVRVPMPPCVLSCAQFQKCVPFRLSVCCASWPPTPGQVYAELLIHR